MTYNISDHWVEKARRVPSPNCDDRPDEQDISLLVLHNISLPPGNFGNQYVEDFFTNQLDVTAYPYFEEIKDLRVSSHLFIRRHGEIVQFVPFNKRAWHAGQSEFKGRPACNDFAIGIELEGTDDEPYEDMQYHSLARVTLKIKEAYPAITDDRIAGHDQISPGRKTDPGHAFDWPRFMSLLKL